MSYLGGEKQASGGGQLLLPAGPAAGTAVASSASANTYGSWVELDASAAADFFIVGVTIDYLSATGSYVQVDIATGAGGSEVSRGEFKMARLDSGGEQRAWYWPVMPWIPVASGTRIAAATADAVASAVGHEVSLIVINQSDVVNQG